MSYLLTDYPSYTNGIFSNLNNNYGYLLFTSNSSITFNNNVNCDILIIGAGGRGGIGYYSGGGGAGEVIYYPSYTFTSNFYNIQIGLDSPITSNRITKISTGTTEIIKAIGGGDGASYIEKLTATNSSYNISKSSSVIINEYGLISLNIGNNNITLTNNEIFVNSVSYYQYLPILNTNPYFWGKLLGNNNDSSGNNYNFINVGTPVYNTSSVSLSTSNYITLSTDANMNLYTIWNGYGITISLWINLSSTSGRFSRIFDFSTGVNPTTLFALYKISTTTDFRFRIGTNAVYTTYDTTGANYFNNTWFHIVWSISSTGAWKIYINNSLVSNNLTCLIPNITYDNRFIGRSAFTADGWLVGEIKDFRIYRSVLADSDVSELYTGRVDIFQNATSGGSGGGGGGYYKWELLFQRYIPKAPTTRTTEVSNRILNGITCSGLDITLDNTGIIYGSGTYELYYSSVNYALNNLNNPFQIFNFDNNPTSIGGHFKSTTYNTSTGVFNSSNYLIDINYKGEWIVIKFPSPIIMNKYIFTARNSYPNRAPKKYRIYGSNDGINWTILDDVNITSTSQYISNKYEKIIPNNLQFSYYCLTINEIFPSNDGVLNFIEIEYYSTINNYQGSSLGSPYNVNYSLLTYGNDGTSLQGGNGGSANLTFEIIKKPNSSIVLYDNIIYSYSINYQNSQIINQGSYTSSINNGSININNIPWGAYFANDWSGTTLLDSSGNGRHATTSANITKTTGIGNGASGAITYISGGTTATITWPTGSIPPNFTIVSLTRYTGGSTKRILQGKNKNWLHGHYLSNRGLCYYDEWITLQTTSGNLTDWLCCIGKNSGSIPNNIIIDGIASGIKTGGAGTDDLVLNLGKAPLETSDWALSAVIIYDRILSDENINNLNNYINTYKTSGNLTQLKSNIITNENFNITDKSYPILKDSYLTDEREYPPKIFDSFINQNYLSSGELFNIIPTTYIKEIIILNTDNIYYGSGDYILYSSSATLITTDNGRPKSLMFDKNISTGNYGGWGFNYDSTNNGYYLSTRTSCIKSDYLGDWLIIELPLPIILTKYQFFNNQISRAPALWRCYGSFDGINWTEIIQASNDITPLTSINYLNGYYEKILSSSINISYKYFGFTINKVVGNDTTIILREFKIFGKEEKNNNTINPAVWYKFDDITNIGKDEMGIANMTNNNGTLTTTGIKGSFCATFNGTNQYLSTLTFPNLNNISFSICCWCVLNNSITAIASFFGYDNNSVVSTRGGFSINFSNNTNLTMRIVDENLNYTSTSSFVNQINFWCFTFDISNNFKMTIYQNGIEVASRNAGGVLNIITNPTYYSLGRRYFNNTTEYANVRLDDFRVYTNKALSLTEVQELYYGRIAFSYKFKENLTLQKLSIGSGGTGATSNSIPVIKNNFGDGGDGNGGIGFQGAVIIRFPFENNIGNSNYSSNLININDNNYSNIFYYNDINLKPSFCNIAFTGNYDDIINKPNINSLSTTSNVYYTSNILKLYSSNINYNTSNNLITFNNSKLNNLNSSLWINSGLNIYNNLGSVGIGTSVFGNNKLVIKGSFKADDFNIKGSSISNLLITSNTFDNKSNNIYNNISNLDFNSKQTQKTSSQFITTSNNLFINYFSNYSQYSNLITSTCNSLIIPQTSQLTINYSNIYNINQGTINIIFNNGSINFNSITDKSYPILKDINPIVWYKFDDSSNIGKDEMGIANMTNNNGTLTTTGIKGSFCASFNGTNQYLSTLTFPNLNNRSFSICCWCILDSITTYKTFFGYDNGGVSVTTRGGFHIYFQDSKKIIMRIVGEDLLYTSATSFVNQIIFWCFTFDISNNFKMTIYQNGIQVATRNAIGVLNIISNPTYYSLGRRFYNTATENANVRLDDFRVYTDKALSLEEVQELYNGRVDIFSAITKSSNVGIGTSSIGNDILTIAGNLNVDNLKIKNTSLSNILINSNNFNNSSNIIINNFNSNYLIYNSTNWITNNSSIYLSSNGNVGIGSTIPKEKLDIIGNINIKGNIITNSCNLGSSNKIFKDLYLSGNSINVNNVSIKNSNNFLSLSNLNTKQIILKNNGNQKSKSISLNPNGDFMIDDKFLLAIDNRLQLSNIVFSNVFNNSSNNINNLNNSKFNSINSTDILSIGSNNRFITNDIYNRPITFSGTIQSYNLITSNLNIIGDNTTFNTTIYQTEQLFIENSCNYPAMIVKQININKNVVEFNTSNLVTINASISGTGNTINTPIDNNNYRYALFTSNGTFTTNSNISCDILVVGGGGGGGINMGSGGGAGGVVYITNYSLNSGTYSISIGNGGLPMQSGADASTANGGNSIIKDSNNNDIITALGGAIGSSQSSTFNGIAPKSGGSGAGGTRNGTTGGSGIQKTSGTISAISRNNGYGNAGGNGTNTAPWPCGGGGGAGGIGGNGSGTIAGNGGIGIQINITGTNTYYAGGGGGGAYADGTYNNTSAGTGGLGGGGNGSLGLASAISGLANTGSGGGGAGGGGTGGTGGSGVIIIRYSLMNSNDQIRFLVNSNGNVGIGTNDLNSKLNVNGNINSSGLIVNNNEIINFIKTNDNTYSNSIINNSLSSNNLYTSSSNQFSNINNSKQDLLNSSTNLLGIGSNISNINYSNFYNIPDFSIRITSINSTSNNLFTQISNLDLNSSNSNINYINTSINNLVKFQWITNGNNVYTNSNVGIGSTIPSMNLDINGNLNTNELLIKKNNFSNIFITSNIFEVRSNNYFTSFSNQDFNSSNNNIIYTNSIVNNLNTNVGSTDIWKINNNFLINNDFITSFNSNFNNLELTDNSIAIYNYANISNITKKSYDFNFYNGAISRDERPLIKPWGAYFANDWSGTTLLDSSGNGRHATTSANITKTTGSGNGITGAITYISGGTTATINWPAGSIPPNFTILGLQRFTNTSNQGRILTSPSTNFLLGYNTTNEGTGVAFFNDGWKTPTNLSVLTNRNDWLCMIGKNGGATPNNIIANGVGRGNATGGTGGTSFILAVNNDGHGSATKSDWSLSAVIIYDTHLTDANMFKLNSFIDNYELTGNLALLKSNIFSITDNSYPILKDVNGNDIIPSAWYKFDDTTNLGVDSSGNGVNLTNYNSVAYNTSFNVYGTGSASFASANSRYLLGTGVNLNAKSFSISFWVYPTQVDNRYIYAKDNSTATRGTLVIGYRSGTNFTFVFWNDDLEIPISNHLNKWNFITLTYNVSNNQQIAYINGVLTASRTSGGSLNSANQTYNIGRGYNATDYFSGYLDDFRIYAGLVLTQAQVNQLYNRIIDKSYPILKDTSGNNINPIAWYKFDNNFLTIDSSGYSKTLTNFNTITTNTTDFIKGDGSAQFNGTNYFQINEPSYFSPNNSFSISLWMKLTNVNNIHKTICSCRSAISGYNIYIIPTSYNIELWTPSGVNVWNATSLLSNYFGSFTNIWKHFTLTFNKRTSDYEIKLYLDGILLNTIINTTYVPNTNHNFRIGSGANETTAQYNLDSGSLLDDFRFYNIALSSNQILELYNGRVEIYSSNLTSNILINSNLSILDNVFSYGSSSLNNTIISTNNSLVLSQNYIAKINNNNDINIKSGTYKAVFNNGSITLDETSFVRPWGAYFADDWSGTTLQDSSGNRRHATTSSGNIIKTSGNGNGASGIITYISGGTTATITWPAGSIPTNFTILGLTRYNGTTRGRILTSDMGLNLLHGHHTGNRGVAYYNNWITNQTSIGTQDDWLCMIGKNGGTTSNNILVDGIGRGITTGGTGNGILYVNLGRESNERSDWALSAVIIYDSHLTDANMVNLNNFINTYKSSGNLTELKSNIIGNIDNSYPILKEERQYPPKLYNSITAETTTTEILGKTTYKQTFSLNTTGISYGNGDYIVYSSSIFTTGDQSLLRKGDLFNFNTGDTGGHWNNNYSTSTGYYTLSNFIKSGYIGDWIIIKLPVSIILTKFRFFHRTSYVSQAPSLWKCYGSIDGITFNEIVEASNDTISLTSSSYDSNRMYEKSLLPTFNTFYNYIGFTFNRKIVDASQAYFCFAELQLFGRELLNISNINPIIWYKFDDSSSQMLLNSSGNGYNLTNNGTTFDIVNFVKGNGSVSFNHSLSQYLSIPSINLFSIQSVNGISFCLWFRMNTTNTGNYPRLFDFSSGNTSVPRWILISRHVTNNTLNFDIANSTNSSGNRVTTNSYIDGNWHHIVWTINNTGSWVIYIDGIIAPFTATLPTNINIENISFTSNSIGKSLYSSDGYLSGNIDDFRIYNQVLNISQVQELYTGRIDLYNINTSIINNPNLLLSQTLSSIPNTIISTSNSLVLSGNALAKFNYINDININSGTYDIHLNNGNIGIGESPYVRPWGAYFANDWSGTTLPDSSGNSRHATTSSGNITKTTLSGNGATGAITYISGGTTSTISWPTGSIPTNFTILSLTRYNGATKRRLIVSAGTGNWLHGHYLAKRGVCHYEKFITADANTGTDTDWLCCIGKNGGTTPNNILIDGVSKGNDIGGTGGYSMGVNNDQFGTTSDFALSAVIIYDSHLTDAHMVKLNNFINTYKSSGNIAELKSNILRVTDNSYPILKERQYPPKKWDTIDASITDLTYNGFPSYKINYSITTSTYATGEYSVFYSNKFMINGTYYNLPANNLFDYSLALNDSADFINTSIVGFNSSGNYIGERFLAENSYKGDWFFIKLPIQIKLTRYIIFSTTYIIRCPALWKIYGSNDGINWEEIIQASNSTTKLSSTDYTNNNNSYSKILSTQSKLFNHIGMCINGIISGAELHFAEFQIFGRETNDFILNPTAWYKFDDILNIGLDSSGNGYHLTNNNSVSLVSGVKGTFASSFNTTNNLTRTNGIDFSGINFSISLWQFAKSNFNAFISSFGNNLSTLANKNLMIGYGVNIASTYFFGFFSNDYNSPAYPNDVNNWVFLTYTYNFITKSRKIYRNGVFIGGNTSPSQLAQDGTTICIGNLFNVGGYSTNGFYDDFRVYSGIELSQSQIQELYQGRVELYNYVSTSNYSSNLVIKGDLSVKGNIKLNNTPLNLLVNNINVSITGAGNSINTTTDNSFFRYALFTSNGTFTIDKNMICDILVVGGGGGGGGGFGAGGGAGALIYKTNYQLSSGIFTINIGSGGGGGNTTSGSGIQCSGTNGNDTTFINSLGTTIFNAKGGGGGGAWGSDAGKNGGSGGGSTNNSTAGTAVTTNIPQDLDVFGNAGARETIYTASIISGGGGGGAGGVGNVGNTAGNGTGGNGGAGKLITITGNNSYYAGGGGGCLYKTSTIGTAGTGGIGGGGNGIASVSSSANGFNGTANTGGGGGGASGNGYGGIGGTGGSGVVIIRYNINQTIYNGNFNYSNVRNRPYMLDLLTSSNIINIGEENNINFPLSTTSWKNEWNLYMGTSPTNIPNSFIFNHITPTINSDWWFNGTTATTNAEISDYRIKNNIQDISNGIDKLMLINPKEYYLCDEKDYHKKYGIIAQDIYKIPELNHLVYKDEDYIANVYSFAFYNNSNGIYIISSLNPIIDLIDINDELKILLDNNFNKEIIIEDLTYHNRYKKRFVKVKSIIDEYSFEIFDDIELNEDEKIRLFIYGKKINDFHKLDYNSLYTLNIKANQEIYEFINNTYKTLDNLTTRIKNLENKLL